MIDAPGEVWEDVGPILTNEKCRLTELWITHGHWDHTQGGAEVIRNTKPQVSAHPADREWIEAPGIMEKFMGETMNLEPIHVDRWLKPGERLKALGLEVEVRHVPGHCPSQLALFFPAHGVFVAADMLSDIEIPWLDGPPWVYRRTLKELHWVFEQEDIRVLVPGHGDVAMGRADGYRRLLRDLDYLVVLERRVADARSRGRSLEETQAECEAMDYLGKDASYAMNDVHRENVAFTWKGLAERAGGPPEA